MKQIEYRTKDKTTWGPGPWQQEPDKAQWKDEATGLPCLIVRNHSGAWCGYVGLSEGHSFYGKSYSERVTPPASFADRKVDDRTPIIALFCEGAKEDGKVSLELAIDVHGGLTFSDFCGEHNRDAWEKWRSRRASWEKEARQYPIGDAARRLREWAKELDDYDAWVLKSQSVGICHLPEEGEPERVWWFGFDCSHAGDVSPGYDRSYNSYDESYRDIEYVKREVTNLAAQLAALR